MEPTALGDDLNEISVLMNVAHRFLLGIRDDVEADPTFQSILDDLNAAHDQIDGALEHIGQALATVDGASGRPREQGPAIH